MTPPGAGYFAGAILAPFIRPGRTWPRLAVIIVSVVRCAAITTYYILPGGLTYVTFVLLPVTVIVAVNLPAARRYFRHAPES